MLMDTKIQKLKKYNLTLCLHTPVISFLQLREVTLLALAMNCFSELHYLHVYGIFNLIILIFPIITFMIYYYLTTSKC